MTLHLWPPFRPNRGGSDEGSAPAGVSDHFVPDVVLPRLRIGSKPEAIQVLADHSAESVGLPPHAVFEALRQRERLGTTGIGDGVAIPHARLAAIPRLFSLFARLETAIDFDAEDGRPVDLIFVLLAPEAAGGDHLAALARVSRLLRDKAMRQGLRRCRGRDEVLALLAG